MARPPSLERRVGPYRLVVRLGGGVETEVWEAVGPGGPVALKRPRGLGDPLVALRLAREATALARVRDGGTIGADEVVELVDVSDDPHAPWIAGRLIGGGSVEEHRRAGQLTLSTVLHTIGGVASVLERIHQVGVVHRDVKPANVLVGASGPVLADFAAASIDGTTFDGRMRGAAAVVGTPGYQAPEAGTGPPGPPLDVFALGVTIAELLAAVRSELAAAPPRATAAFDDIRRWASQARSVGPSERPTLVDVAVLAVEALGALEPGEDRWSPLPRPDVAPPVGGESDRARDGGDTEHGPEDRVALQGVAAVDRIRSDALAAGEPRTAVVLAEPGSGKTHLLDRVLARAADDGWFTARVHCDREDTPPEVLHGWVDALSRVAGRGGGVVAAQGRASDPDGLADVVRDLVRVVGPTVLVLDDVHLASPEVAAVVEAMSAPGPVVVVVVAGRPGRFDADDLGATTVALAPLDDRALSHLVRGELGREPSPDDIAVVRAASAGHPLRARLAAAAIRRGHDVGAARVEDLIAQRSAGWDAPTRDAVALAATCGARFWPEALGPAVTAATIRLIEEGLVEPLLRSRVPGSAEVAFGHDLIRGALRGTPDVAPERERAVALALDRAQAPAVLIVDHAVAAVDGGLVSLAPLAARRAREAARSELDHWSPRAAAQHVETGMRMLGTGAALAPTPAESAPPQVVLEQARLDIVAAEVRRRRGDPAGAIDLASPYASGRAEVPDAVATEAIRVCARAEADRGGASAAVQWGRRLVAAGAAEPVDRLDLATALVTVGSPADALRLADEVAEQVTGEAAGDDLLLAEAHTVAALAASGLAFATQAPPIDAHRRAVGAWERWRRTDRRAWTRRAVELVDAVFVSDWDLARRFAEEAHTTATELGEDAAAVALACFLGDIALESDDPETAQRWLGSVESASPAGRWTLRAGLLRLVMDAGRYPGTADAVVPDMLAIAEGAAGTDSELAYLARIDAAAVLCWEGRPDAARRVGLSSDELAPLRPVLDLLDGPPWDVLEGATPGSVADLERIFRLALSGDDAGAAVAMAAACRARRDGGLSYPQRVAVATPAYLFPALAPPSSDPPLDWARRLCQGAALDGMWALHRSLLGAVLSRRGVDGFSAEPLMRTIDELPLEPTVRRWVEAWAGSG